MLKITGTMMLVLMLTTLTASAAWLAPTESDQSTTESMDLTAETTWNGNGLRYVDYHNNETTLGTESTMWLSAEYDTDPWVAYGFDTPVTIDAMSIWNFNDSSQLDAGIEEFRILYTTDTTLPLASRTWIDAGTKMMAQGTGSNYYFPNTTIDVAAQLPALDGVELTGIMLEVLSSYGSNQVGLSEIRFTGEEVPEPATMGLLAVGGIAMLRSRRRRNNK